MFARWATPAGGKMTYSKLPVVEDADDTRPVEDSLSPTAEAAPSSSRGGWGGNKITFSHIPLNLSDSDPTMRVKTSHTEKENGEECFSN